MEAYFKTYCCEEQSTSTAKLRRLTPTGLNDAKNVRPNGNTNTEDFRGKNQPTHMLQRKEQH